MDNSTLPKNNGTLSRVACAIVFVVFSFVYLYYFQADVLAMVQHVMSGGVTRYDRTVGAVLITIVLYLVHVAAKRMARFDGKLYFLTYFPSLLFLAALTDVKDDVSGSPFSWIWLVALPLMLVAYFVAAFFFRQAGLPSQSSGKMSLCKDLWINLLSLSIMLLLVCGIGNTDRVFHYRMRMENLFCSGKFAESLKVGDKSADTDESLVMLRAYALSRQKLLGERLFEYPMVGGSSSLLPDDGGDVKCRLYPESDIFRQLSIRRKGGMGTMEYLLYIERNGLARRSVTDYLLCGYLLDKNLDAFVREARKRYNLTSPTLPKHYREALTLYTHLRSNPIVVYRNEVMDVDYSDFQKLERQYPDKAERESYVRDTYGDTYWFYYFYHPAS